MSEKHATGPIQVLIIGFDDLEASGAIMAELRRVRKRGVIRIVDVLFAQKDAAGEISSAMHMTDLSAAEREHLGGIALGLLGVGAGSLEAAMAAALEGDGETAERETGLGVDRLRELAEAIPPGGAAAVLVIEHHWATRLRDAVADAGGRTLMQAMVSPDALVLVGEELRAKVEAEAAIEELEEVKLAAAIEIAQTLTDAELIEERAIAEAADAVAMAIAIEDATADDVVRTLLAADLVEEEAREEAADVVSMALEDDGSTSEEDEDVVTDADEIEAAGAVRALRALVLADLIESEAAHEAVEVLVEAGLVEAADADQAVLAVLAQDEDEDEEASA